MLQFKYNATYCIVTSGFTVKLTILFVIYKLNTTNKAIAQKGKKKNAWSPWPKRSNPGIKKIKGLSHLEVHYTVCNWHCDNLSGDAYIFYSWSFYHLLFLVAIILLDFWLNRRPVSTVTMSLYECQGWQTTSSPFDGNNRLYTRVFVSMTHIFEYNELIIQINMSSW